MVTNADVVELECIGGPLDGQIVVEGAWGQRHRYVRALDDTGVPYWRYAGVRS